MSGLPRLVVGVSVAFAASGCAQLFGIDDTTGSGSDGGLPPGEVSAKIDHISIAAQVATAPQDLTGQTATYTAATGAVTATAGTGVFTATIPDGTPPIELTLPDVPTPYLRVFDLGARSLTIGYVHYEHPNPQPAPVGATIAIHATLPSSYVAAEAFQVYSVGTWGSHTLTAAELPAPDTGATSIGVTLPYDSAAGDFSLGTSAPLAGITTADQLLLLRYVGSTLTGYLPYTPFTGTGADSVTGTMSVTTANKTLTQTIDPTAPGPRLAAAHPAPSGLSMYWEVLASVDSAHGQAGGTQLNLAAVPSTQAAGPINASYANPFGSFGWGSVLAWLTSESRQFTDSGSGKSITLSTGLQQFVDASNTDPLDLPAGVPLTVSIDHMPLVSDGMAVALDLGATGTAVLAIDSTDHATNDLYEWTVYELVPGATALSASPRLDAYAVQPTVTIPTSEFVAGHIYTIRAFCRTGGYPSLATGDIETAQFPTSLGYHDSGAFTVSAQ